VRSKRASVGGANRHFSSISNNQDGVKSAMAMMQEDGASQNLKPGDFTGTPVAAVVDSTSSAKQGGMPRVQL